MNKEKEIYFYEEVRSEWFEVKRVKIDFTTEEFAHYLSLNVKQKEALIRARIDMILSEKDIKK